MDDGWMDVLDLKNIKIKLGRLQSNQGISIITEASSPRTHSNILKEIPLANKAQGFVFMVFFISPISLWCKGLLGQAAHRLCVKCECVAV